MRCKRCAVILLLLVSLVVLGGLLPTTGDMRRHEIDLIRKISKSMKMDGCERRIFYLQTVDTQRKSFFGLHPPRERYIAKKQASGRYEQTNTLARVVVPQ